MIKLIRVDVLGEYFEVAPVALDEDGPDKIPALRTLAVEGPGRNTDPLSGDVSGVAPVDIASVGLFSPLTGSLAILFFLFSHN